MIYMNNLFIISIFNSPLVYGKKFKLIHLMCRQIGSWISYKISGVSSVVVGSSFGIVELLLVLRIFRVGSNLNVGQMLCTLAINQIAFIWISFV